MRKLIFIFVFIFYCGICGIQGEENIYSFLNIPLSSKVLANGGALVSYGPKDLNMVFSNPALLNATLNNKLSFSFDSYFSDLSIGAVSYARKIDDKSNILFGIRYFNYGEMKGYSNEDVYLGTFQAKDMAFTGIYSWKLSDYLNAGGSFNFVYSSYDEYTSLGVGVDLGLYYNSLNNLSVGLVLKNIGTQITAYDESKSSLSPILDFGISEKLQHAPFVISLTGHDLLSNRSVLYINQTSENNSKQNYFDNVIKHLVIGLDFIPSDKFYLSAGFNFGKSKEFKLDQRKISEGSSFGFGINGKKYCISASYANYYVSNKTLMLNISFNFDNIFLN